MYTGAQPPESRLPTRSRAGAASALPRERRSPSLPCEASRSTAGALTHAPARPPTPQDQELWNLLDKKPGIVAYDGFEPSGRMHIAQARRALGSRRPARASRPRGQQGAPAVLSAQARLGAWGSRAPGCCREGRR